MSLFSESFTRKKVVRQLLKAILLNGLRKGAIKLLCLNASSSSCTLSWNQSRLAGAWRGTWCWEMKRMESLKPKPVSWNMERSLSWELWCLHHRKGMNSSVLLELVIIPNRVRYCILASRNQSSTTAHQANITLSSCSSKHDSPSALVFLSSFVQKLLLRHRPCVLWWIFFHFWKCKHTFGPVTVLPLLYCLPFFKLEYKLWVSMLIWSSWLRWWHSCRLGMVDI